MRIFISSVQKIGKFSLFHIEQCTLIYFLIKKRIWKNQIFMVSGPKDSTRTNHFKRYDIDVKGFMYCDIPVIALKQLVMHIYAC